MPARTADRLDSWKEIAAHLGRSVRTVRRWEAQEGLPVHRHLHRAAASVYAFRSEVDAWQGSRGCAAAGLPAAAPPAAPTGPSVAVLPFSYVGPDAGLAYLADGFTDEVIAHLSKVRGLRVISRTSSMALKGSSRDVRAIGRTLGVAHLVEGSVRHQGSQVRVAARLLVAADDDRVWADTFDGTMGDVFAIQERIARAVVAGLALQLSPEEDRQLAERGLDDPSAWQLALQARQEALRWRPDAIDRAVDLLRHGIALVGDNVELYAALGRTHLQYREAGIDFGDGPLIAAQGYADKVFSLAPQAAAGLRLRAWIHYSRGEVQAAVRDLGVALERGASDPDVLALLANCYLISGRVTTARPLIERLLAVDPLTPLNRCMPGWAAALEGDFGAAVAPYREMLALDPGNPLARLFCTWVLAAAGDGEAARETADRFPEPLVGSLAQRVASLFSRALAGEAVPPRDDLSSHDERLATTSEMFPRFLAQAHALAGNREPALDWLAAAVDRGFVNYPFLARHDPHLRALDGEPRFERLLAAVKRRWESFEV